MGQKDKSIYVMSSRQNVTGQNCYHSIIRILGIIKDETGKPCVVSIVLIKSFINMQGHQLFRYKTELNLRLFRANGSSHMRVIYDLLTPFLYD